MNTQHEMNQKLEALRQKKQPFVRIELWRKKDGKMAWTNPYYFD